MSWKDVLVVAALAAAFSQALAQSNEKANSPSAKAASGLQNPLLKVGEPFLLARSRILRSGWRPMRIPRDYEYIGTERELAERNFLEVAYCSIDRGSLCVLYYRKGSSCLRVGTVGEQLKYMKITYWATECPSADELPGSP